MLRHIRLKRKRIWQKLEELDNEVRTKIQEIPEASRVLVTAHDAFGYFGEAYGMKVMGLQGISTAAEYGAKDVSELRDYLVDNNIKAVFVESSVPAKAMEAIIAGAAEKRPYGQHWRGTLLGCHGC